MASFKDNKKGVLRLGAARSIAQTYLPLLINIFSEHFPNIQISVTEGASHEIIQKISEFKDDLGIIPKVPLGPKFVAHTISSEKMEFVASGGHPFAHRIHIPMEELLRQPFIIQGEGSATRLAVLDIFDKYQDNANDIAGSREPGDDQEIPAGREGDSLDLSGRCPG